MAKGIYKITNNRTGEVYIGQTNNLYYREKQHYDDLASGTHHNKRMQQDYNRGDSFSFQVLEYVNGSRNELYEREKAQIKNHNSFYAGYNQTPGGEYDQYKGAYEYGGGRKYIPTANELHNHSNKKYKPNGKSSNGGFLVGVLIFIVFSAIGSFIGSGASVLFMILGIIIGISVGSTIEES